MAEPALAADTQQLRREGMADAALIIARSRRWPMMTFDEWGDLLGLRQTELRQAIDRDARRRAAHAAAQEAQVAAARAEGPRKYPCRVPDCEASYDDPRGRATHEASHELVECEGCGQPVSKPGMGSHRRACPGTLEAEGRPLPTT